MVSIMEEPTGLPNTKSIRKLMCDQWFPLFQIYLNDLRSFLARTRNSLVLLIFYYTRMATLEIVIKGNFLVAILKVKALYFCGYFERI